VATGVVLRRSRRRRGARGAIRRAATNPCATPKRKGTVRPIRDCAAVVARRSPSGAELPGRRRARGRPPPRLSRPTRRPEGAQLVGPARAPSEDDDVGAAEARRPPATDGQRIASISADVSAACPSNCVAVGRRAPRQGRPRSALRRAVTLDVPRNLLQSPARRGTSVVAAGNLPACRHPTPVLRVRGSGPCLDVSRQLADERATLRGYRWWSVDEIETSGERFYPGKLPAYLRRALTGEQIREPFEWFS
jgi:hypothetical protein